MLIDEDGIAIGIQQHQVGRAARRRVCPLHQRKTAFLQERLQIAHIGKWIDGSSLLIPARIEGQRVLRNHPLEQADHVIPVAQNEPVLLRISASVHEA